MTQIIFPLVIMIYCILLSIQDIKDYRVSNWLLISGIVFALMWQVFFNIELSRYYFLSSCVFFMYYFIIRKITRNRFGKADVYFGLLQGACLEIIYFPVCIILEVLLVVVVYRSKLKNKELKIPFIPFMSAALIVSYILQFCDIIKL